MPEIEAITLPLPYRMGSVNCYLVRTSGGFVLIDTGAGSARGQLEERLAEAGCGPGTLNLIVLTHGDFDHTGNAAYLRGTSGARIAMHCDDAGMAERGDMFWNRSSGNAILRWLAPVVFRFAKSNRFVPDVHLDDGDSLSTHGFDARIVSIPGHSRGSIGILTNAGDLFCGDLLENLREPARNSIMDDLAACDASIDKLAGMGIGMVYPGHGEPFAMDRLLRAVQRPAGSDQ
jgi:glyoxylase-like metal-dependent hydrolase (beta-lactamase superfamily II)